MSPPVADRVPLPAPIFILGITPRSGTNLLYRMLLEHPDCAPARQPGEDFLVHGIEHLLRYVEETSAHWNPEWDVDGERSADLMRGLGRAWLVHLRPETGSAAFVTKTPSIRGIGSLHRFLPEARVLAMVRDGRDVAESGVRSFGWTYGEAFRDWAAAARELVTCLDGGTASGVTVVRFEALVRDTEAELDRVLEACGLDGSSLDFEAASSLPVYGSSSVRGGERDVHWDPVPAPEGFDPVGRWSDWDDVLSTRYDRVCGEIGERLGYVRARPRSGALRRAALMLAATLDRR